MSELIVNQHASPNYKDRTIYNASSSDVTLALATDLSTRGEQLTKRVAGQKYIGFELTDEIHTLYVARQLFKKMKTDNASTLNIAGNSIFTLQESGCSQEFINQFVYEVLSQTNFFYPIQKIYTGGQTGVDIAGAVAAVKLGIPAEVTLPHGYLQRHEDNKDRTHNRAEIIESINYYASILHQHTPLTKEQLLAKQQKTEASQSNNSNHTPVQAPATIQERKPAPASINNLDPELNYSLPRRAGRTFDSIDDIMPNKPTPSPAADKQEKSTHKTFGFGRK